VDSAFQPCLPCHLGTRPLSAFSSNVETWPTDRPAVPLPDAYNAFAQISENGSTLSPVFPALSLPASLTRLTRVNRNSFTCHSYKKHPGWGIPPFSANSVYSALKSTRPFTPTGPSNAKTRTPSLTPLSATLTKNKGEGVRSASSPCRVILPRMTASSAQLLNLEISNQRWPQAVRISPLSATLTENTGEGAQSASRPCRVVLPRMTASSAQLLNLEISNQRWPQAVRISLG
jgi:hypothetical protein